MDFGVTSKTNEYLANLYQKNKAAGTVGSTDFLSAIFAKAAEKTAGILKGYVMTFDENGEINNACVVGEGRFTVSSSEFVEARKAREARHAEYERIAKENAIKRKLQQQIIEQKRYQSSIAKKVLSVSEL